MAHPAAGFPPGAPIHGHSRSGAPFRPSFGRSGFHYQFRRVRDRAHKENPRARSASFGDGIEINTQLGGKAPPTPAERSTSNTNTPARLRFIDFAKQLWRKFQDDDVLNAAATLAFFFLLAIFPAAVLVLSLLPSISIPHLQQSILDLVHQVLPEQSAMLLEENVRRLGSERTPGLLTFGLIFTVWSASAGVYATIEQLNSVYGVKDRRGFWKAHGVAILLLMLFVLLAIASLSLAILGGVVQSWLASIIGRSPPLLIFFATLRWVILAVALLVALAVIYRFGPDVNLTFRLISPGNGVAASLIAIASIVFRFYVFKFGNYNATYGNLAAVIILILWMYLFGIALLVGCEINAILRPDKSRQS